jgi:hypothetical protein
VEIYQTTLWRHGSWPSGHQEALKYNIVAFSEEIEPGTDNPEAFVHPLRGKTILFHSSSQMEQVIHISSRTVFHIYQCYLRICPPRPAGGDSAQYLGRSFCTGFKLFISNIRLFITDICVFITKWIYRAISTDLSAPGHSILPVLFQHRDYFMLFFYTGLFNVEREWDSHRKIRGKERNLAQGSVYCPNPLLLMHRTATPVPAGPEPPNQTGKKVTFWSQIAGTHCEDTLLCLF